MEKITNAWNTKFPRIEKEQKEQKEQKIIGNLVWTWHWRDCLEASYLKSTIWWNKRSHNGIGKECDAPGCSKVFFSQKEIYYWIALPQTATDVNVLINSWANWGSIWIIS